MRARAILGLMKDMARDKERCNLVAPVALLARHQEQLNRVAMGLRCARSITEASSNVAMRFPKAIEGDARLKSWICELE